MPDITMCTGKRCNKKEECYRYMAVPSEWQSIAEFAENDGSCSNFWKIEEGDRIVDSRFMNGEDLGE